MVNTFVKLIPLLAVLNRVTNASRFFVINDIHLNVNATYTMPMPTQETNEYLLELML